ARTISLSLTAATIVSGRLLHPRAKFKLSLEMETVLLVETVVRQLVPRLIIPQMFSWMPQVIFSLLTAATIVSGRLLHPRAKFKLSLEMETVLLVETVVRQLVPGLLLTVFL